MASPSIEMFYAIHKNNVREPNYPDIVDLYHEHDYVEDCYQGYYNGPPEVTDHSAGDYSSVKWTNNYYPIIASWLGILAGEIGEEEEEE